MQMCRSRFACHARAHTHTSRFACHAHPTPPSTLRSHSPVAFDPGACGVAWDQHIPPFVLLLVLVLIIT